MPITHSNLLKKSQQPLVSIGIPTYGRMEGLKKVVHIFRNQTHANIEIIISDNGGIAQVATYAQELCKLDSRIRYIRQSTKATGIENFNSTLYVAKGEYFLWSSDDDLWDDQALELLLAPHLEYKNIVLTVPKFLLIDQYGKKISKTIPSFSSHVEGDISFAELLREPWSGMKAIIFYGLFRTQYLKKIAGYNKIPVLAASDMLTLYEITTYGRVYLVDKVLFYKRNYFTNSNRKKRKGFHKILHAISRVIPIWYIIQNIFIPTHLFFLLWHAWSYGRFTIQIIDNNYSRSFKLKYSAICSAISLFLITLPNDFKRLVERTERFSGKKLIYYSPHHNLIDTNMV